MSKWEYFCNDPSHPPIIREFSQETTYWEILRRIEEKATAGVAKEELSNLLVSEFVPQLISPAKSVDEGYRVQLMRRKIAGVWGEVFHQVDNLCFLTGWFILDCMRADNEELSFVLSLLALEGIRNVFATVNQLRSALTEDTFGYWRTLYETLVKSRFLIRFASEGRGLTWKISISHKFSLLEILQNVCPG